MHFIHSTNYLPFFAFSFAFDFLFLSSVSPCLRVKALDLQAAGLTNVSENSKTQIAGLKEQFARAEDDTRVQIPRGWGY